MTRTLHTTSFPLAPRRRSRRLALIGATMALGALVVPSCSDDDATEAAASTTAAVDTDAPTSTSVVADATSGDDAPDGAGSTTTVAPGPAPTAKDPDAPTTSLQAAKSGVPDNPATNSQGAPIELDETALLACAQNQIAWVALQRGAGAEASDALAIASQRAAASAVPEVQQFAATLDDAADSPSPKADVDEFLALCVERGFEY